MEIIDKEQLFKDFWSSDEGSWGDDIENICECGFVNGFNKAEEIYSKQIEEKDKEIEKYQLDYLKSSEGIGNLGKQLQEAKELLKNAVEQYITDKDGIEEIEAFLNK